MKNEKKKMEMSKLLENLISKEDNKMFIYK